MVIDNQILYEAYKSSDVGEADPINDTGFAKLEFGYVSVMASELAKGVERIYDSTDTIVMGLKLNYDKDKLYEMMNAMVSKELGVTVPKNMQKIIAESVEKIYQYSSKEITKASFRVIDYESIEYLKASDNFYVGKQFGRYADSVREIIREEIFNKGLGANQVAKSMADSIGEHVTLKFSQYENVARTSANRVRNWSRVFSYEAESVKKIEIVAVMDERTSEICSSLNGTIFEVKDVANRLREVIGAGEDNLVEVSPFPSVKDKFDDSGKITRFGVQDANGNLKNVSDLLGNGISAPPYHGRCRTILVESL